MKKTVLLIEALFIISFMLGCDDPTTATSLQEAEDKYTYEDYYIATEAICMGDYKDSAEACMVVMLYTDPKKEAEFAKRITQRGCDLKDPRVGKIQYEGSNGMDSFWTPKACENLYTWFGADLFSSGNSYNYDLEEGIRLLEEVQEIKIPVYKTKKELIEAQMKEEARWK